MGSKQKNAFELLGALDDLSSDCDDLLARIDGLIARCDAALDGGSGAASASAPAKPAARCTKADIASLFTGGMAGGSDPDAVLVGFTHEGDEVSLRITWPENEAGQLVIVETDGLAIYPDSRGYEAQALADGMNDKVRGYVDHCLQSEGTSARERPLLESLGAYVAMVLGEDSLIDEVRVRGSVPYEGEESLEDVKSLVALIASLQVSLRDR